MVSSYLSPWHSLSLAEKVAQLVVVRASGHPFDHQRTYPQWEASQTQLDLWVGELGVGGVIFLGGSAVELALRIQHLQGLAKIPLLLAADVEEGVGQRFGGASELPPPLALGALARQDPQRSIALAEAYGRVTAQEAVAVGLNWLLAPVVDVNNNPQNPVINVRAFGETPTIVSALAPAFIRGCQGYPVLTTAKHFPGHGDTHQDSHLELPVIPHDRSRLQRVEWPPFQGAIAAGVSTIMTAHLALPALDPHYPATLSHRILTEELRQGLGFEGLIVTDALIMQAISQRYGAYEAPILALEAGADVILMPVDPPGTIVAIVEAIQQGRLSEERLEASLERLWRSKQQTLTPTQNPAPGSHGWETEPAPPDLWERLHPLSLELGKPLTHALLTEGLEHRHLGVPVPRVWEGNPGRNLILVDNLCQARYLGLQAPAVTLPQTQGYSLQWLDRPSSTPPQGEQPTLLQLFVRGNPFRGTGGTSPWMEQWFEYLMTHDRLVAVVVYGSPYAWESLNARLPATCPSLFSYGQMPLAQTIVLNRLFSDTVEQNSHDKTQYNPREFTT